MLNVAIWPVGGRRICSAVGVWFLFQSQVSKRPDLMIAVSRLLLAATMLIMAIANDNLIGFVPETDDLLSAFYLYLSVSRLLILASSWWLNFRLRLVGLAIDCTFYLIYMYLVEPMHAGSFSMTVAMLSFLIVSVGVQWGWRQALLVAIIANALCIIMIAQMAMMDMPMGPLLRRQAYQLLISVFLVWAMNFTRLQRVISARLAPDLSLTEALQRMLEIVMAQSGANVSAICWTDHDERVSGSAAFRQKVGFSSDITDSSSDFPSAVTGPTMFDTKAHRAAELSASGRFKATRLGFDEREFIGRYGIESGVYVPLMGASGSGRLIYARPAFAGVEHLRLAAEIGTGIAEALDNQSFLRSIEQRATDQQRTALARDIHDSLSQSFAGARFWLNSLLKRIPKSDPVHGEIAQMSDLFQIEQAQVQRMIESLRGQRPHLSVGGLDRRIELIRQQLSQIWSMDIKTTIELPAEPLPDWTLSEVPLMVREALANAARHGRASAATIELRVEDNTLHLIAEDNGTGMPSDDLKPGSLTERTEHRGGTLDVCSKPGSTRLEIALPLRES